MNTTTIKSGESAHIMKTICNKQGFSKTLLIYKQMMMKEILGSMQTDVNISISRCHFEIGLQMRNDFVKEGLP